MTNNRSVGLWMLPAHVAGSRSMLAAVQRDFARLRTLDHPNIARLLELGHNGQQYFVTGERLDGEPLREVLNHLLPERPEIEEADEIVRAIGAALVYAHERGIAHGDVRAENVLVTMDRRFVLTNFLARRVAKMASRPPRPSEDLKALARLAAELYTGSISPRALRDAAHGDVPAARLNAIRAVLENPRRFNSVAEFLEEAGLDEVPHVTAPRQVATPLPKPQRSWSLWRLVVPMTAVAILGSLAAAYHGGVRVSAEELKVRGLDALRAVAARVAPTDDDAGLERAEPVELLEHEGHMPDTADVAAEPEAPAESELDLEIEPPHEAQPVAATVETSAPQPVTATVETPAPQPVAEPENPVRVAATETPPAVATGAPASAAPAADEPPGVSLDVPRIAAREDHSVVAIDVVRSGDVSSDVAVSWWAVPDTAHEEEDYAQLGRRTLEIPAGAAAARVLIPIVNDGVRESDEVFTVHLGRPRGGAAGPIMATRVTLHDDD